MFLKFYYLGNTIGRRKSVVDNVMTKIRNGWSKFRNFKSLLESKGQKTYYTPYVYKQKKKESQKNVLK